MVGVVEAMLNEDNKANLEKSPQAMADLISLLEEVNDAVMQRYLERKLEELKLTGEMKRENTSIQSGSLSISVSVLL